MTNDIVGCINKDAYHTDAQAKINTIRHFLEMGLCLCFVQKHFKLSDENDFAFSSEH